MIPAVLFIIGAAVVGPIEAHQIDDETYIQCHDRLRLELQEKLDRKTIFPDGSIFYPGWSVFHDGAFPCNPLRGHIETLPELCARAMKEMQITVIPPPEGARYSMVLVAGEPLADVHNVTCIPVPEGYRK